YAQANLATVTGVVTDSANALVPGVALTIRNVETNITREMATSPTGDYTITNLAPGTYEVKAAMAGFRSYRRAGVVLQVGQVLRLDIQMELGAVTESVTVSTAPPTLNTESGTIKGDVIVHEEIQELPLDGRDFTDLAYFVPGVVPKAQGGQGSAMNVNGARATNTNFYVDGFNNRNARGAAAQVRPNIDALQEFKMEVSGFSAEYGRMAGGILNMVLRSGTNDHHGSLFHYLRNDILDARGFFDRDKNKLRRNQFGATLSGPVIRNRTFYLVSFEGYTQVIGLTRLGHTPTAAEREGDFSSSVDVLAQPVHLKDPFTSGRCTATERAGCFPDNRIPASLFDPIGLKILRYYPLPNRPDIGNNYIVSG
ncbi:MAG: TonB-dependent receptor, partial [Acidobacteriota bacterium]